MTREERHCILARVNLDRGDASPEKFTFKRWLSSGKDWKVSYLASVVWESPANSSVDMGIRNHLRLHHNRHLRSSLL